LGGRYEEIGSDFAGSSLEIRVGRSEVAGIGEMPPELAQKPQSL
jgi:hypothetical protein